MVMNAEMTPAKIGRSMKKLESFRARLAVFLGTVTGIERRVLARAPLAHGYTLRLHLGTGAHPLQAVHHDGLAGREARLHHPQAVDHWSQLHRPVLDLVVLADDENVAHRLIGPDGAVVHQHRVVLRAAEQADAGEQPRRELPLV